MDELLSQYDIAEILSLALARIALGRGLRPEATYPANYSESLAILQKTASDALNETGTWPNKEKLDDDRT